jgi:DNA polymerase-3 subunit epsilon
MRWWPGKKTSGIDWPAFMAERADQARDIRLRRFLQSPLPGPETPMDQVPMAALDMETTGLDEKRHAIVSIGIVPFTLSRIRFSRRFYQVVRPPRPLNEESITFHGITHAEVARAPDLREVLEPILNAMAGRIVVVHYRGIERPFLNAAVKARLGEELFFPMIDTMELEARRHRQSYTARLMQWMGRAPTSIRLYDSRTRYHLPYYQAHHALTDALATAELLQAQILTHYSPATPLKELWC